MHWTVAGADAIMLRCCQLNGRFKDFWARRSDRTRRPRAVFSQI
jgi:hypothetical protein